MTSILALFFLEIGMDGCIVMRADAKCLLGKPLALSLGGAGALSLHDVEQSLVLRLARNNDYIVEVLCTGTDE